MSYGADGKNNSKEINTPSCFALEMVPNHIWYLNRVVPNLCRIFLLIWQPFLESLCNIYHVIFLLFYGP